jgi:hypothetical protein
MSNEFNEKSRIKTHSGEPPKFVLDKIEQPSKMTIPIPCFIDRYGNFCEYKEKRLQVATACLQGVLAREGMCGDGSEHYDTKRAVKYADALLKELGYKPEEF